MRMGKHRPTNTTPTMRALLKPFVIHAAYQPIETIVFFSIVGTLAYFHVISAIKHSAFWGLSSTGSLYASYSPAAFASSPSVPPNLKPAYALLRGEDWVAVRESFWNHTTAKEDKDILSIELYTVEYESKKAYFFFPFYSQTGLTLLFRISYSYQIQNLQKRCWTLENNYLRLKSWLASDPLPATWIPEQHHVSHPPLFVHDPSLSLWRSFPALAQEKMRSQQRYSSPPLLQRGFFRSKLNLDTDKMPSEIRTVANGLHMLLRLWSLGFGTWQRSVLFLYP